MSEDRYVEVFRQLQLDVGASMDCFYTEVKDPQEVWMDDDRAYRILEICRGDSDGYIAVPESWWDHFKMAYFPAFLTEHYPIKIRRIYIGNSGHDKFIEKETIERWTENANAL